jgi:hypothetical protein
MRNFKIQLEQRLINTINAKKPFTYYKDNNNKKNYVVSVKNLYKGKNPSLYSDMIIKINEILKDDLYDSLGLWIDKQNTIFVDANINFYNLDYALNIAKECNQKAIWDIKNNCEIYI